MTKKNINLISLLSLRKSRIHCLFLILVGMTLVGCHKKDEPANQSTVETEKKITLLCKGIEYETIEIDNDSKNHQYDKTTSYVFTVDKLNSFQITKGSGPTLFLLNYEYPDQPGSPKARGRGSISEQIIQFQQSYWTKIDDENNQAEEFYHEIEINRISGEWIEKYDTYTMFKDKTFIKDSLTSIGVCEKANQKF